VSRGVRGVDWELTPPPDDGHPEAVVGWMAVGVAFLLTFALVWFLVLPALRGWV
jgi:hypothetical protein